MATIKDVAERAGLSRATVSRVINNHAYVTEEKKRLVYEAMKELNYVPNSIARHLRKQTTETIAVLVPRISNPFFSKLVEVMEMVAAENIFQLIVCQTRSDKMREMEYLDMLKTKQIAGVIMVSIENDWEDIKDYSSFGPIFFCNEYPTNNNITVVGSNQFNGGYLATRHLLEKGHKIIAFCSGEKTNTNMHGRKLGFDFALKEFGFSNSDSCWFRGVVDIEDGRRVLRKIIAMKDRPTAVFTGSDEIAAGIIKEARMNNIQIPDELAVVGYDNQSIAELMEPGITTINQPVEAIGKRTMELMINYLRSYGEFAPINLELPLCLIERNST
ncbi:LacI family DNA-binding transcriptional regulator [Radiobacillus sp. PE A8.2]|uniref:LacI family DNA-binding transcriptional regulator n=1 Tax=Radiobacillus sp. PE A8.2 TaxID=3380349 RepID=UPI00388F46EF